ncbi:hypothetical protein C8R44DRAFT_798779 [Mycena epipterygia]|nr:hypothetical protein C8R44DRAFT_798779 [Mycena epipterygia]
MSFSRRWKHILLAFPHHETFAPFETLSPDDVPMLQSITVDGIQRRVLWTDNSENPAGSFKFLSFLDNHTLQNISIPASPHLHKLTLPWARLKSLAVENGSIACDDATALLRECPALETCVLSISDDIEPTTGHRECISLLRLRHFSVSGETRDPSEMFSFFNALLLPNLRSLQYSDRCSTIGNSLPFSPLFVVTNSLEHLSLDVVALPGRAFLTACLAAMPLLQELSLTVNSYPDEDGSPHEYIVTQLTPSPSGLDPILCPLLKSLDMAGLNETVSDEAILELVRARTAGPQGVARLSRASFVIERDMQVDILPLLEDQISAGLTLSIQYLPHFFDTDLHYSPAEGTDQDTIGHPYPRPRWEQAIHAT